MSVIQDHVDAIVEASEALGGGQFTQPVDLHAWQHQYNGIDQMNVTGLLGILADQQSAGWFQGRPLVTDDPLDGQVYVWNDTEERWELGTPGGGGSLQDAYLLGRIILAQDGPVEIDVVETGLPMLPALALDTSTITTTPIPPAQLVNSTIDPQPLPTDITGGAAQFTSPLGVNLMTVVDEEFYFFAQGINDDALFSGSAVATDDHTARAILQAIKEPGSTSGDAYAFLETQCNDAGTADTRVRAEATGENSLQPIVLVEAVSQDDNGPNGARTNVYARTVDALNNGAVVIDLWADHGGAGDAQVNLRARNDINLTAYEDDIISLASNGEFAVNAVAIPLVATGAAGLVAMSSDAGDRELLLQAAHMGAEDGIINMLASGDHSLIHVEADHDLELIGTESAGLLSDFAVLGLAAAPLSASAHGSDITAQLSSQTLSPDDAVTSVLANSLDVIYDTGGNAIVNIFSDQISASNPTAESLVDIRARNSGVGACLLNMQSDKDITVYSPETYEVDVANGGTTVAPTLDLLARITNALSTQDVAITLDVDNAGSGAADINLFSDLLDISAPKVDLSGTSIIGSAAGALNNHFHLWIGGVRYDVPCSAHPE